MSVTSLPKLLNMWTNSTPVTPEPMITKCWGTSGGGYAWRVVSIRRPSGLHHSGTRGRLPVASTTTSAVISRRPSAVSATTSCGPTSDPVPVMMSTPWLSRIRSRDLFSVDWVDSMYSRRPARSIVGVTGSSPIPVARDTNDITPPAAIMALDGMQSHRLAAPPRMSFSTRVTSAPRRAATDAQE